MTALVSDTELKVQLCNGLDVTTKNAHTSHVNQLRSDHDWVLRITSMHTVMK